MANLNKTDNRLLKLNVGFLLKEGAGYSREFVFDEPRTCKVEDIFISHLKGTLRLTRTPQGILVQGTLHARTTVECVRCLTPFELHFDAHLSELFTLLTYTKSDHSYTVDEKGYIDLVPIMREEGILAVPIQALCKPDCKGLCSECGQDLNVGTCDCVHEPADPRLASLRTLLID